MLGGSPVSASERQRIERDFGLDQPLSVQFVDYLVQLSHGNLGTSFRDGQPVSTKLWAAAANTLPLVGVGVALGIILGVAGALLAIVFRNTWLERIIVGLATLFFSTPAQWLGMILIILFAAVLPIGGRADPFAIYPSAVSELLDILQHMILPSTTLMLLTFGAYTLVVRSAMLEVVGDYHVQFARARGFSTAWIVIHDVLRNSLLPTVNLIALSLGTVFGGAILIEVVFSWPGLGLLARNAVDQRDYPVIQGTFLVVTFAIVVCNFIADVLAGQLDPRVEIRR
jgi:peptide/nickel transport system permease protein